MQEVRRQESPRQESPRSPEAQVGLQVEDLWDVQEPQLSPTEKLNACFESIPVSAFPQADPSKVVEITSDTSLAEAVQILAKHRILGAPVLDVDAPEDATWIDRYIGIVEFAGIVVWILHQSEGGSTPGTPRSPTMDLMKAGPRASFGAALAAASSKLLGDVGTEPASPTAGNFFEVLTESQFYKNTTVKDISGSFRWAPFLALETSNSFLTMLLLLSNYKMKSIPVIDVVQGKIDNIITQSSVIHMLAECSDMHWFENWGNKKLDDLGLPLTTSHLITVSEDEPVLQAFKLMRKRKIGGVPVIENGTRKAIGNISLRDVQFLLMTPEIYHKYRSISARNFLTEVRSFLESQNKYSPMLCGMITCGKDHTLKEVIQMLDNNKIHRIYVVDAEDNLEGVITLRDIISKLVHEPKGYFGDFFDGVLPLPANSRV
uniref:CBS domain-containing protein n=1 Tax=Kalanchoe fedtschenkoi TaxID=63787 RepID=A0A7N0RAH1_KALFE